MTVLALGVGATSTFAWYKAEQTVTAALGDTATKLTAAKETADGEEVKLNFKLASTTNPELTDREDGEAYYLVDTVDGPKKVKNSSAIKIGQYAIEVEWQTGDQLKWAHAAKTGSISIDVKAVAQEANKIYAELLKADAEDAKAASVVNVHTYTVNIAEDGALSWQADTKGGKYALRPGYTGVDGEDPFTADAGTENKMSFNGLLAITEHVA